MMRPFNVRTPPQPTKVMVISRCMAALGVLLPQLSTTEDRAIPGVLLAVVIEFPIPLVARAQSAMEDAP